MATSNTCSLSSETFKMPSEPCPLPSLGSDEESFVVLWKDMDSKSIVELNHEPIGTSVVEEAKQLINKELSEMEQLSLMNKAEKQAANGLLVDGLTSANENEKLVENNQMDESTVLPKMPQVEKVFDTSDIISITTLSTDLSSEQVQKKISEIVEENIRLKDTILQNNMSMKSQYERIVAWQEDVQKVHQAHKEKILEAKEFIEKLKKENYNLTRELEQTKASKCAVEEKISSLNCASKEKEQLTRTTDDNIKEFELDIAYKKIREMEVVLNNITQENIVLQNDKTKLFDANPKIEEHEKEIDRLQTSLHITKKELEETKMELMKVKTTDEEKLKSMNEVIETLRSQLMFRSQQQIMLPTQEEVANIRQQLANLQVVLTQTELARNAAYGQINSLTEEVNELKAKLTGSQNQVDEIFALKAQLDVYKADFEAEKSAKETIKIEKEKLAEDMQNLQRRNQQLQEEIDLLRENEYVIPPSQNRSSTAPSAPSASSSSTNSPPLRRYACPICNLQFRSLKLIQDHVDTCIAQHD